MNIHFVKAERLVEQVRKKLKGILGEDGEDISCYNPSALDTSIFDLIEAKTEMALGREKDG